ncbi:MAG TPA: fibronectin type III domain-containing protein [Anaerolineales bacterium]|nr:fibronectin type III domain-containing protein [Anaerolineales bacterium]
MKRSFVSRFPALVACLLVLVLILPVSPAAAARDRQPPTTPTNLHVTGMTPYSVSLAWNPSTDNSGSVTYTICCANVSSETFPGPASTRVYTAGLEPGRTFTFRMFARDPSGNVSKYSNFVTFTLPPDTTVPEKPTVTVTDVGATHISLAWSSVDDSPKLWFTVLMNGSPVRQGVRDTSGTFGPLEPETSYTFTVQAMDFGGNRSPVSDPLTVTTEARDTSDTVPPTTPGNFRDNGMSFQDGETWLFWDASTDNVDPPSIIRYDVYVNGVFDHSLLGYTQTVVYGNAESENTFLVIAVDSAGNESAPATLTTCAVVFC